MTKPLAKELKAIKEVIKDFKDNRTYAKREEKQIIKKYAEKLAEYDSNNWYDHSIINSLTERQNKEINNLYDMYGNDATIHIIYNDGTECIAQGTEIVAGDIIPKLQHIAYASYQDGYTEYDTLTGCLDDRWNLEEEEGFQAREQYFNEVEIKFNTTWGRKHQAS
jgi:predicted transcriptional regulator